MKFISEIMSKRPDDSTADGGGRPPAAEGGGDGALDLGAYALGPRGGGDPASPSAPQDPAMPDPGPGAGAGTTALPVDAEELCRQAAAAARMPTWMPDPAVPGGSEGGVARPPRVKSQQPEPTGSAAARMTRGESGDGGACSPMSDPPAKALAAIREVLDHPPGAGTQDEVPLAPPHRHEVDPLGAGAWAGADHSDRFRTLAGAEVPAPLAGRAARRSGRAVKTRLLGFGGAETEADPCAPGVVGGTGGGLLPTGWLVVIAGPGRGNAFTLSGGVSQIGRGEDQAVRLDFGDTSISRHNHAAVAYDPRQRKFYIGHGGKANLVRLNGKPVLSTEELPDGSVITIGETTLRFVALCGAEFDWSAMGDDDAERAVFG